MTGTCIRRLAIQPAAPGRPYGTIPAAHPDRRSRGTDGTPFARRRARLDRAGIPAYLKVDGPHDRDLLLLRPDAPRRPMSLRPGASRRSVVLRSDAPRRPMVLRLGVFRRPVLFRFGAPRRPVPVEVDGPHDRDLLLRPGAPRRSVLFRPGAPRRPVFRSPFPDRPQRRSRWRVPMRP